MSVFVLYIGPGHVGLALKRTVTAEGRKRNGKGRYAAILFQSTTYLTILTLAFPLLIEPTLFIFIILFI